MKRYAHKKILVFDMDGTLAESKVPLTDAMLDTLRLLLSRKQAAVISGGSYPTMQRQLRELLHGGDHAKNLYLLPTNGSVFYSYTDDGWQTKYALTFSPEEKKKVFEAFEVGLKNAGFQTPEEMHGDLIEDRDTQVTFSAHGMKAPVELKKKWDPDQSKRKHIVTHLSPLLPEFEIGIAGGTSIDVMRKGIDKSYGARKLMEHGNFSMDDILFFGDMIFPGGNDYPIHAMGIESIKVTDHEHTRKLLLDLLE